MATTVICTFRVADYDAFRPGYDKAKENFSDQIRTWRLWRGQDDPDLIVIQETFDSREVAEGIWATPTPKRRWKQTASTWRPFASSISTRSGRAAPSRGEPRLPASPTWSRMATPAARERGRTVQVDAIPALSHGSW